MSKPKTPRLNRKVKPGSLQPDCSVRPSEAEKLRQEIAVFNRERDEALLSLDETKIRAMFRKWNESEMPENPEVFWGSVHKAITGSLGLPIEFRRKSKSWLAEHGFHSLDDGDL